MLSLQAKKASSSIFRFQKQCGRFQPNDAFKLFDAMVKPVACYGAEIWGYEFCEEIEKVQSRFCKYFIGLKQQTNDSFAIGECGRLPLVTIKFSAFQNCTTRSHQENMSMKSIPP